MKMPYRFSLLFAALFSQSVLPAAHAIDESGERPVRILQTVEAKFPNELISAGVREGEVRAILLVDADGKLGDCLISAYSHPEFAVELLSCVRSWEYVPAMQNGQPTGQRIQIVFHFNQKGSIVSMLPAMAIQASLNRFFPAGLTALVCKANELDRTPAIIEKVSPRHPGKQLDAQARNGNALIDFYIDSEGKPRMPVVMKATHEEYAIAAAEALMNWRFEPPMRQGRPIAVRMVQEFLF